MLTVLALSLTFAIQADTACIWNRSTMPGRGVISIPDGRRTSPKDSVSFRVGTVAAKVCYSRPALRGRTMIGGEAVPYGQVWRTGANEATMIHTTGMLMIAGVHVEAGTYAIYTVPGEREWEIIVNRSYLQWGHEAAYSDSVRAQEVGRGRVPVEALRTPVESFTIRAETARGRTGLVLEWDRARVVVPVTGM